MHIRCLFVPTMVSNRGIFCRIQFLSCEVLPHRALAAFIPVAFRSLRAIHSLPYLCFALLLPCLSISETFATYSFSFHLLLSCVVFRGRRARDAPSSYVFPLQGLPYLDLIVLHIALIQYPFLKLKFRCHTMSFFATIGFSCLFHYGTPPLAPKYCTA